MVFPSSICIYYYPQFFLEMIYFLSDEAQAAMTLVKVLDKSSGWP